MPVGFIRQAGYQCSRICLQERFAKVQQIMESSRLGLGTTHIDAFDHKVKMQEAHNEIQSSEVVDIACIIPLS